MRSRPALRILSTCGLCLIMSACGTDVVRMSEQLNPFAGSARFDPKTTGSLSKSQNSGLTPAADVGASDESVKSSGPIASAPLTAPTNAPSSTHSSVVAKAQTPVASQKVAALSSPVVNSKSVASAPDGGKWIVEGGTEVTLAKDETVKTLADRYGVPEEAIRSANGIKPNAKLKAGTKLIIPVHVASGIQPTKIKAQQTKTAAITTPAQSDTPADAVKVEASKVDTKKLAQSKTSVKTEPAQTQQAALETPASSAPTDPANATDATKVNNVGFRWPAKGRIVQTFGDKGGVKSTGINISVPEGTPIKAAEAGTVAYAGNEVKGFGNLVMVRHADGWVSVYANASEIKVKRGDIIKRGQVIALSGQSGDVSAPQLHFELRKGSVPVDPVEHLSED